MKRSKTTINEQQIYELRPPGRSTHLGGIYVGFIKEVYDQQFMGRIRVWIPELGGDVNDPDSYFLMNYASPFAGATPWTDITSGSDYSDSQRSYGMLFMPPDLENEVVCCFINGDPGRGVWFGCLFQQYMNNMVPGIPGQNSSSSTPVGEYNKLTQDGPNNVTNPIYTPLAQALEMQGLSGDPVRGTSSTGMRRSSPSLMAYGILTPQGNQFVMDDNPGNAFIRLRTQHGSQILVNDTTGCIYMNSNSGNSWLELSADGHVEIYGFSDISIRAQGDINYHADQNFNIEAGENINMRAGGSINAEAASSFNVHCKTSYFTTTEDMFVTVGGSRSDQIKLNWTRNSSGFVMDYTSKKFTISSANDLNLDASSIIEKEGSPGPAPKEIDKATSLETLSQKNISPTTGSSSKGSFVGTICSDFPTHEPYAHPSGVVSSSYSTNVGLNSGGSTGGGGGLTSSPYPIGSSILDSSEPLSVYGTPSSGMTPGYYQGVGYDSKGEPIYKFIGTIAGLNAASHYSMDKAGLNLTEHFESWPRGGRVYKDAHGEWDIGYGYTLPMSTVTSYSKPMLDGALQGPYPLPCGKININGQMVDYSNGLTRSQGEQLLIQSLNEKYCQQIRNAITVKITQNQFNALVDMAYNLGIGNFQGLISVINSGNFKNVPNMMMQYDHYHTASGELVVSQDLLARCQARVMLWVTDNSKITYAKQNQSKQS